MKRIIKYIKNPKDIIVYLMNKGYFRFLSDEVYTKWKYKLMLGRKLDLKNPKTYSEKLQWLKLYNRKQEYTTLVDKYEAKEYLSNIIGAKYLVKTYGIYEEFDEINFDKLPNQFVIKCTHDSGGLVICKDKSNLNLTKLKKTINKCMQRKYFYLHREWPYKNVKPRILIEELLENNDGSSLIEYNIFCFNGNPEIVMVCYGDKKTHRYNDYYDINFKKLDLKCIYDTSEETFEKPKQLNEMIEISKKISKDIPQLRVDFYLCNDSIYIGELTFFHWAGYNKFEPVEWDLKLGNKIKLPKKTTED